jgi:hypothetical protein
MKIEDFRKHFKAIERLYAENETVTYNFLENFSFTSVHLKISIFWDITQCSLVKIN